MVDHVREREHEREDLGERGGERRSDEPHLQPVDAHAVGEHEEEEGERGDDGQRDGDPVHLHEAAEGREGSRGKEPGDLPPQELGSQGGNRGVLRAAGS